MQQTGGWVSVSFPSAHEASESQIPRWGRKLTVPCPRCALPTQRHRSLVFDGVNIYRPQAGPDPARVLEGQEPAGEQAWIALMPGDYPARFFADAEVFHLVGGIAWPGPHHRDYGSAKVSHDVCCPVLHHTQPTTSQGAGELWRAMRLRRARGTAQHSK